MNLEKIQTTTHNLETTILKYSPLDEEVANFQKILRPLINRIKAGETHPPIEWRDIPGSQCFTEGTLRKYRDLERDYAEFRFAFTD